MATNILIEGMLSGTGVRQEINGGDVEPEVIGPTGFVGRLIGGSDARYERSHCADFGRSPSAGGDLAAMMEAAKWDTFD